MSEDIVLARYLAVLDTGSYTPTLEVGAATVVVLQIVNLAGTANVALEWSVDKTNWQSLATWEIAVGAESLSPVTGLLAGWIRVAFTVNTGEPLILRVVANLFVPAKGGAGGTAPPAPPIG